MPPLNTSLRSLLLQPTRCLVAFCPRSLVACWLSAPGHSSPAGFCPRSLVACWLSASGHSSPAGFLPTVTRRLLAFCPRSLVACWLSAPGHSSPAGFLLPPPSLVALPTLLLSASSMSYIFWVLQKCLVEASRSHDINKPLQFASSHRS